MIDEPRTTFSQTDTYLPNASLVLESTPQKRRFPFTRRASTRSTTSPVARREDECVCGMGGGTVRCETISKDHRVTSVPTDIYNIQTLLSYS